MALTDGLLAYWKMDEASGNRLDSSGNSKTLTDNNTVTTATAKLGANAAHFVHTSSEYLSRADAAFNFSDSFTLAFWLKPTDTANNYRIVSKWADTGNQRGFTMRLLASTDQLTFWVSKDGADFPAATNSTTLSGGTWYFVVAYFDKAATTFGISVNNNTPATNTQTALFGSSASFQIGAQVDEGTYFSGDIDEFGVWTRALSATERSQLYNGGNGLTYPFNAGGGFLLNFI